MTRRLAVDQAFDLEATLSVAQDFRWFPREDGWYSGVLGGRLIHLRQGDGWLEYRADRESDAVLRSYFRLDDDVRIIWRDLAARDETLLELQRRYGDVRVRRQPDRWECMVAYICSANRSVEGIRSSMEKIAAAFGERIELGGDVRYAFPTVERVLAAGEAALDGLCLGLGKHHRILAAAREIADGRLDLDELACPRVHYADARMQLMALDGIGPKIADCIALFALDKLQAFPVDRWVRRALGHHYFAGGVPSDRRLVVWAQQAFGPHAGYANQLLFHAAREGLAEPR